MKIETQKGIWVSSSFTGRFGNENIKPSKKVLPFQKLPRAMNDNEIQKELGVQECTLSDVATFLKNPPVDCDDGYFNLFYLPSCVVFVRWSGAGWSVYAWRRDDFRWYGSRRVFSPATSVSETENSSESVILPDILVINGIKYKRV